MKKLLAVVGPTATGKTDLALSLAEKYNGELVSCDSRQVYKGLDIVTGKDLPENFERIKSTILYNDEYIDYYLFGPIPVWMLDIISPPTQFHVSDYYDVGWRVIEDIWKRNKLPIIVGGTAFYFKSLLFGVETIGIPKNEKLREKLETISVQDLQKLLKLANLSKLEGMNNSDRSNPRRLIRAIEIATHKKKNTTVETFLPPQYNSFIIGLKSELPIIYDRIDKRVDKRIEQGAIEETEKLIDKYGRSFLLQLGTGYSNIIDFFDKKNNFNDFVQKWKTQEHNDARKQLTFFNKLPVSLWVDIQDRNSSAKVEEKVMQWYTNSNET